MIRYSRPLLLGGGLLLILLLTWWLWPSVEQLPPPVPQQTPSAAAAPVTPGEADLILDLFSPSEGQEAAQRSLSAISDQIENGLVISFILARCDRMSERDYADTYRSLVAYAQQMGLAPTIAEADVAVHRLADSAGTSYALIYSRTRCNDVRLDALEDQLAVWRKAYR